MAPLFRLLPVHHYHLKPPNEVQSMDHIGAISTIAPILFGNNQMIYEIWFPIPRLVFSILQCIFYLVFWLPLHTYIYPHIMLAFLYARCGNKNPHSATPELLSVLCEVVHACTQTFFYSTTFIDRVG